MPSPDDCVIEVATLEQRYAASEGARPDFAPHATPEEYRKWYDRKLKAEFAQNGRWIGWVLIQRRTSGPVLSYLETVRRDGWSKDDEGKVEMTSMYGVVYVFTPPANRKHGYATRLLRQLHYVLAGTQGALPPWPEAWGALPDLPSTLNLPPSCLSYLSSAAPLGFYERAYIGPDENHRLGWEERRTTENAFVRGKLDGVNTSATFGDSGYTAVDIYYGEMLSLASEMSKVEQSALERTTIPPGTTAFRVDPTSEGTLAFIKPHLPLGCDRFPERDTSTWVHGVRLIPSGQSPRPYHATDPICLFIPHGFKDGELLITYLDGWDERLVKPLLAYLREVGRKMDPPCDMVWAWGLDETAGFVQAVCEMGGKYGYRGDKAHRFCPAGVAWYGDAQAKGRLDGLQAWAWL